MDIPRECHTKWSKSDRKRLIYDIIYMWNIKKLYKWIYLKEKLTHKYRKHTYGYQKAKRGGINSVFGINTYTLL